MPSKPIIPRSETYEMLIKDIKKSGKYKTTGLNFDVLWEICSRMEQLGLSQNDLKDKMKIDKMIVSRILNGKQNMTLATMIRFANALDCRWEVKLIEDQEPIRDEELKRRAIPKGKKT